jgi:hypothetical protein
MMTALATTIDVASCAPVIDLDRHVALSLARANTTALMNLSALARREMITALTDEVARLHTFEDGPSQYAAEVLSRYIPDGLQPDDLGRIHLKSACRHKFKV